MLRFISCETIGGISSLEFHACFIITFGIASYKSPVCPEVAFIDPLATLYTSPSDFRQQHVTTGGPPNTLLGLRGPGLGFTDGVSEEY